MMAHESDAAAVISIGRMYCDLIFTGLDRLPELGRELYAADMAMAPGGGAFIAAAHLARLGRPVALAARLGTDRLSAAIEDQIEGSGVDIRFLERAADAGPQVTVAAVVGAERAFLTRRAGRARPATLEAALSWPKARHLHIGEYATLHEIPDLVARAKAQGLTVSLDTSWDEALIRQPGLLAACAGVDVFLPNLEEAAAITGHGEPAAALAHLSAVFPVVALKGGGAGGWVAAGGSVIHQPARPVTVVDTTGAGDAFNAGFLHAWLDGASPAACLAGGIEAGSRAVQVAGGVPAAA